MEKKKSSNWLYIVLAIAVGYFIFDNLTSDKSVLKLSKSKNIFSLTKAKKVDFNLQTLAQEEKEFFKFRKIASSVSYSTNPFYFPIKKARKTVKKPAFSVTIEEIYDGEVPYIQINGDLLTIDDEYKGWKIIEITSDGARFQKNGTKVFIKK